MIILKFFGKMAPPKAFFRTCEADVARCLFAAAVRAGQLPRWSGRVGIAKFGVAAYTKTHVSFLSAFPMFVPSLSWKNDDF